MARIKIDEASEDTLFRIFDASQGAQRRVFRVLARGFFNELAIDELRRQTQAIMADIDVLAEAAKNEAG